ncbi:hypothetical protein H6F75_04730 [Nodosilinea sp. FACHB-131]|uniref:hypothetical protein n=1 Tax=Cyanophyceae TaxID=3028117 RepID=UPI001684B73A|nr:hypothetical protein [Nodosilinea sp. FACHB-131]MBD1872778.1 hypothetical protein [Nodosilinea sp. FACHB-131]
MRETFTAEEWSALLQAPMHTVMGICLADRVDPVLFLQEVKSGVAIVAEAIRQSGAVGGLAPALISGIAELDAADPLSGEQLLLKKQFELLGLMQTFKSSKEGRDYAIAHLQRVAAILDTKVTGVQASELKQWLVSVATKVAEAHREGGLLGIGSSRISDKESDVLNKMSAALGLVV